MNSLLHSNVLFCVDHINKNHWWKKKIFIFFSSDSSKFISGPSLFHDSEHY